MRDLKRYPITAKEIADVLAKLGRRLAYSYHHATTGKYICPCCGAHAEAEEKIGDMTPLLLQKAALLVVTYERAVQEAYEDGWKNTEPGSIPRAQAVLARMLEP